jgi:hypothetical protein
VDRCTWQQIQRLFQYWNVRPPLAVVLRGIAVGLGATFKDFEGDDYGEIPEVTAPKHTSAEEFLGIIGASNLNVGIINGSST